MPLIKHILTSDSATFEITMQFSHKSAAIIADLSGQDKGLFFGGGYHVIAKINGESAGERFYPYAAMGDIAEGERTDATCTAARDFLKDVLEELRTHGKDHLITQSLKSFDCFYEQDNVKDAIKEMRIYGITEDEVLATLTEALQR